VDFVVGTAEEHKSATANVAGLRMNDSEREPDSDSGVDGIASGLHDVHPGLGSKSVNANDHGMLRANGLRLGGVRDERENAAK
jgi:hypothetical protein